MIRRSILNFGFCLLALFFAGKAQADDSDTLFPSHQLSLSLFGESDNGNVVPLHKQEDIYGHTTLHIPAGAKIPTGVVTIAIQRQVTPQLRAAAALRPLAATAGDPVVTIKTRRLASTTGYQHNTGGGGAQLSWFFNRYVGLALEGDLLGSDPFASQLTGQLILRYPIDLGRKPIAGYSKDDKQVRDTKDYKSSTPELSAPTWGIAPYFIAGGGTQWDDRCQGIADVGAGIEFRFSQHWGVALDGRWFVHDSHQNYAATRLGLDYQF